MRLCLFVACSVATVMVNRGQGFPVEYNRVLDEKQVRGCAKNLVILLLVLRE